MAFHQCFTRKSDRQMYCSAQTFKDHDSAATWISQCLAHFGIRGDDVGQRTQCESPPAKAIVW